MGFVVEDFTSPIAVLYRSQAFGFMSYGYLVGMSTVFPLLDQVEILQMFLNEFSIKPEVFSIEQAKTSVILVNQNLKAIKTLTFE